MYFVATHGSGTVTEGKLPLTAVEALAYVKRARETPVEIRDEQGRVVSVEQLRKQLTRRNSN